MPSAVIPSKYALTRARAATRPGAVGAHAARVQSARRLRRASPCPRPTTWESVTFSSFPLSSAE